jgi:4,5-dihydroxyphthalate decarboxylase
MSKLQLSVAVGNYDRVRPLLDGAVQIDGVDPVFMNLPPEEIFFRAFRSQDFDICELSLSSFTVKTAERNCPYVGVPAFVSRAFRHNSIYVRRDRVRSPADLKGKRVGTPEYQLTACVWARIILEDDHGVKPSDVVWVRGGIEHPGRPEKITIKLPAGMRMEDAPAGSTISGLLERGDIDAFIAPRVPSLAAKANPDIGWLFPDPIAAGQDYFKRTGIFPSCMSPASGASSSTSIPGCRRRCSRHFRNRRRSASRRSRTPPRARSPCRSWRSSCAPRAR